MDVNTTRRRTDGTFDKGVSGNPKGRPKKDRRIPHPDTIRDMHYDVAEFATSATINGKRVKLNLLQSNLLTLALAGAAGDKAAARLYLTHMHLCTEQELRRMEHLTKHLRGVTPAYVFETDPVRRARAKAEWREVMAEASGSRKKTTGGLGKRTSRR